MSEWSFSHTIVPEMAKGNMFLPDLPEDVILTNARAWNRYLPNGPFMTRRSILGKYLLTALPSTVDGGTMAFLMAFLLAFMHSTSKIKMSVCMFVDGGVDLIFEVQESESNKHLKGMERAAFGVRSRLYEYDVSLKFNYCPEG
ncbi:hypothetical protein VKT23_018736 [Stygiomarasmius scandens]|uniref:Uncharacterized protein n=1 Tax=Marasmiellus scandens TaxID=2682957 RepID=A0ABR1IQJ4_9AGAR